MNSAWKSCSCSAEDIKKTWECDDSVAKRLQEIVATFYQTENRPKMLKAVTREEGARRPKTVQGSL